MTLCDCSTNENSAEFFLLLKRNNNVHPSFPIDDLPDMKSAII